MTPRTQNLLMLLGVLVLGYLGYYLYSNANNGLVTTNELVANQASAESAEFLRKLNQLKDIELDGSLFSDPRFRSLNINKEQVRESDVGRDNPFIE